MFYLTVVLSLPLAVLAFTYALFLFYLAYCTLWQAKKSGKWEKLPWPVRAMAWGILGPGVVLDGLFNVTIGSVAFWEWPELNRLMFTARCSKWMRDQGWRGRLARWVCDGWLNPFQENHCH